MDHAIDATKIQNCLLQMLILLLKNSIGEFHITFSLHRPYIDKSLKYLQYVFCKKNTYNGVIRHKARILCPFVEVGWTQNSCLATMDV